MTEALEITEKQTIMAFITTEAVKAIREELKIKFPDWKFSIQRRNYSTVNIYIMAGTEDWSPSFECVNHFHIKSNYTGTKREILQDIADIALRRQVITSVDSDYGSIPNYYVNIRIGDWDRPYEYRPVTYEMKYYCEDCDLHWRDTHDCACNDKCPECNKEYTPCDVEKYQ